LQVQSVIFSAAKEGYAPDEWEDGAAAGPNGAAPGGTPSGFRFAVADGATESYESRRWAEQLIDSFMAMSPVGGTDYPESDVMRMHGWLKEMQDQWQATAPAGADYIEKVKIRQGTLATFIGGQILGLDTAAPAWRAVALGDSILFHVRQGQLVDHFPRLRAADFDSAPDGISTLPDRLGQIAARLLGQEGRLAADDTIFLATDAFAQWMITCHERGERQLWPLLADLAHPDVFFQLVADQRRAMLMKDDDVTLMRLRLLTAPASTVVTCL
jgi:hypothetical protein